MPCRGSAVCPVTHLTVDQRAGPPGDRQPGGRAPETAVGGRKAGERTVRGGQRCGLQEDCRHPQHNYTGSTSRPFFDRSGSVHAARSKQQGRRLPLFIFEMLTSTRRLRVSGFLVALIQRIHSQRAIGVISIHMSRIFCGAVARADSKSCGTFGSGQSVVGSISSVAVLPTLIAATRCSFPPTLIQWPREPSGSSTAWNSWPLIVPFTATCPREGSFALAFSGNRTIVHLPILSGVASKRIAGAAVFCLISVPHPLPQTTISSQLTAPLAFRHRSR